MSFTISHTLPLLLTLAVVFLYLIAGRLITAHTDAGRFTTPAHSLIVGMGLWLLWWLAFAGVIGIGLKLTWWLFLVTVLALMLGLTKVFRLTSQMEHFWTKTILALGLLLPVLWWATATPPMSLEDLLSVLHYSQQWLLQDAVAPPILETLLPVGLASALATIVNLPVFLLGGTVTPGAFHILNWVVLGVAASALIQLMGTKIKWSNLPWVAGGALIGITLLNPFFSPSQLMQASTLLLPAFALFIYAFALLGNEQLPRGWGVLTPALAGVVLIMSAPSSLFWWGLLTFIWLLRDLIALLQTREKFMSTMSGWLLLVTLPLLAWLGWQIVALESGIGMPQLPILSLNDLLLAQPLGALLALLVLLAGLNQLRLLATGKSGQIDQVILVPALLTLVGLVLISLDVILAREFLLLQFVLLAPLWHWFQCWYQNSSLRKLAFAYPWRLGLLCCALLPIGQYALANLLKPTLTAPVNHVWQVSQSLGNGQLPLTAQLAVIDTEPQRHDYAALVQFGLGQLPRVGTVTHWLDEIDVDAQPLLHAALKAHGYTHLWIHAPDNKVRKLFHSKMSADKSYLILVEAESLRVLASWPHPRYTNPGEI